MLTFGYTLPVKADSSTGTTDQKDTTSSTDKDSSSPTKHTCDSMDEAVKLALSNCKYSTNPEYKDTCWGDAAFQKCHGS